MKVKIYYEDTDAGGVVYHSNYLKYFERARTEYMLQRGIDPAKMVKEEIIFVVVYAEVSYLAPARYGDTLIVDAFVQETSNATITFGYKVYPDGHRDKLLVTGKTKIAMVNNQMKPQRLSADFIERINASIQDEFGAY
jgi:acyl-CoA thioester hydrolase